MDKNARYNVLTWDGNAQQYTEQEGVECLNLSIWGVRRCLRTLRDEWGYPCNRNYEDSDPAVLVERVDDPVIDELLKEIA